VKQTVVACFKLNIPKCSYRYWGKPRNRAISVADLRTESRNRASWVQNRRANHNTATFGEDTIKIVVQGRFDDSSTFQE